MKRLLASLTLFFCAAMLTAQPHAPLSPAATTTATVNGKTISIHYSSPRVRDRAGKLFGTNGLIAHDPHYPIWRAGANAATALHTDADLEIGDLQVPKGDYSLFVDLSNPSEWVLVISKATGEWGLSYDKAQDLGHVKMSMVTPPALQEELTYSLPGLSEGKNAGKLILAWENFSGSVDVTVK